MLFVVTMEWAVDKTPEVGTRAAKEMAKEPPRGVKRIATYQLLGRCQAVSIVEAPDEKSILQIHAPFMDIAECDWAPAMTSEEVLRAFGD